MSKRTNEVYGRERADGRVEYFCECGNEFGPAKYAAKRHYQDGCTLPVAQWILDERAKAPKTDEELFKEELEAALAKAREEGAEEGLEQGLIYAFEVVECLDASEGVVAALATIAEAIERQRAGA